MAAAGFGPGPAVGSPVAELVEVCARQADELAGQAEAAQRAVAVLSTQLFEFRLDEATATGCWLGATLRVLANSLGELHTALDEAAGQARQLEADDARAAVRVPAPRPGEAAGWTGER